MNFSTLSPALGELSTNWLRLFAETCELLTATAQVVKVRTTRLVMAGPLPNERDRTEFSLMSREKSEAVTESIQAMGSGFVSLGMDLAMATSKHIWATSAAAGDLASSRSATQWLERQAALIKVAAASPANPLKLASSTTRLVQESLAPIHGRATANAKRLGVL
ncbi:polyhydroxyalkanoate granule-associated phasin [Caballeronia sordidicola]|uniref:polyhydroxyalkanoate granule-associated phasin n=1 Tax=Caballeronia sordidicola TaxID=196367 RepID=UPI00094DC187|nr:polyhydroxyalkanoate granule-associated phasin [Caballeronia sordidicola]